MLGVQQIWGFPRSGPFFLRWKTLWLRHRRTSSKNVPTKAKRLTFFSPPGAMVVVVKITLLFFFAEFCHLTEHGTTPSSTLSWAHRIDVGGLLFICVFFRFSVGFGRGDLISFSRWWQLKYFWNFHPKPWGNHPIWRAYFSTGLVQPPTSKS